MRLATAILVTALALSAAPLGTGTGAADEVEPGARLAGVVGVQGAEVENEVAERTLSRRVERAGNESAKAAVVAAETDALRDRLSTLRDRREQLEAAYEAGEISRGTYQARLAQLTASVRGLERRVNRTRAVAADLPEPALERRGVNVTALARLRSEADEMTGREVRDVARSLVGDDVGRGLGAPADGEDGADDDGPGRSDDAPGRDGDPDRGDDPSRDDATGGNGGAPGRSDDSSRGGDPADAGADRTADEARNRTGGEAPSNAGDRGDAADESGGDDGPAAPDDPENGPTDTGNAPDDAGEGDTPSPSDDRGNSSDGAGDDRNPSTPDDAGDDRNPSTPDGRGEAGDGAGTSAVTVLDDAAAAVAGSTWPCEGGATSAPVCRAPAPHRP
jgi:hypothetical protein